MTRFYIALMGLFICYCVVVIWNVYKDCTMEKLEVEDEQ